MNQMLFFHKILFELVQTPKLLFSVSSVVKFVNYSDCFPKMIGGARERYRQNHHNITPSRVQPVQSPLPPSLLKKLFFGSGCDALTDFMSDIFKFSLTIVL